MTGPTDVDVAWLVQDVQDDLDAGRVGLYEFIWALRGRYPAGSMDEFRPIAKAALEALLSDSDVRIVWLIWPESSPVGVADLSDITDEAWADIGDGPYLGLVRS